MSFPIPRRSAGVANLAGLARIGLLALLACASPALAQEHPRHGDGAQPQPEPKGSVLRLLPADSVTEHTLDTPSGKLAYTATAGTLSLYDQNGERSAAVFYTAYVAKDSGRANRPLTFVFNGGPGAASAYLHLGLVGPKILEFAPDHGDLTAARLVDNPDTWIGFSDLVLIDPVGSGWSRPAKPDATSAFYGVHQDAEAIAKVIALYVAKNGRNGSPKFLLGESYGGFRAAKVARALQHDQGIGVAGILMVSPLIDGALQFGGERSPVGTAVRLPSLAATQLERTHSFSEAALADAEHFALGEYLTMLAGPEPTGEAAHTFYARVAKLTGLPEDVVAKSRGFINQDFVKGLQNSEHKIVSPYDATFAAADPFPESGSRDTDTIVDGFTRGFAGAFVNYAREELGYKTEITYELLNSEVSRKWDWPDHGGRSPPNVNDDLRIMFALDPTFRLLVAHGRNDLVTPYFGTRYIFNHFPRSLVGDRAILKAYTGGHMFYVDPQSRHAFTADARDFIRRSAAGE